jgi:hypothetical protein
MSSELRWLRGAGRRPRYVGFGGAERLFCGIADLSPWRGTLERAALAARRNGATVDDERILEAWRRLRESLPDTTAALLLYTGFYKDTVLSGIVVGRAPRFVKVFSADDGQEEERRRLELLRAIVPREVTLPELSSPAPGIAAYPLLTRSRRRPTARQLQDVALTIGLNAIHSTPSDSGHSQRDWQSYLGDTAALIRSTELAEVDLDRLTGHRPPPAVAHGDFTPWNVFRTGTGELALVDYERVGLRAPFTDAWHLATQPRALRSRASVPDALIARVSQAAGADAGEVRSWYDAYLLQDLNQDATDWVVQGRRHPQLRRLIRAKAALLDRHDAPRPAR